MRSNRSVWTVDDVNRLNFNAWLIADYVDGSIFLCRCYTVCMIGDVND